MSGGDGGDAELPSPLCRSEVEEADQVVRKIGQKDSGDDHDLEGPHKASAKPRRRELGDVDGAKHRGASDAQASDETGSQEQGPVRRKGAADRGEDVEDGGEAKHLAGSEALAERSRGKRSDDRSPKSDGDGDAQLAGG